MTGSFVEIDYAREAKEGERAEGDVFLSRRGAEEGRLIAVLSDGLGSGVKANVLATLTASIAASCAAAELPIERTASVVMRTLPVCSQRRISYSTFTIVDIASAGRIGLVEYDNPPYVLVRGGAAIEPEKAELLVERSPSGRAPGGREGGSTRGSRGRSLLDGRATLRTSSFQAKPGDRLVVLSDGVTQAGMGTARSPLGWGSPAVRDFILGSVAGDPGISARDLSRAIVREALARDAGKARDDITCGVVYFRDARRLLVVTGPPYARERDAEMARVFRDYPGRRLVAGGTTASILSRETGAPIRVELGKLDPEIPPAAAMAGADLVTEGIMTLGRAAELLERPETARSGGGRVNAATRAIDLMLESDIIEFLVGTRINEAHQDPAMPVELEIRRNVIKRLAAILEERYLKQTKIRFI